VTAVGTTAARAGEAAGPKDLVAVKLDERGRRVRAFGSAGIARLDLGGSEEVAGIANGWFGDVYVAGSIAAETEKQGFVVHIDRNGRLDRSFGARGILDMRAVAGMERVLGVRLVGTSLLIGGSGVLRGRPHAIAAKLDLQGRLVMNYGRRGIASLALAEDASGAGTAFFSELGAAAVSVGVPTATGTQIATALFDRRGKPRGTPVLLDAPSGTEDGANAGAFFRGRAMYIAGATYPEDFATGDAFLARSGLRGALDHAFGGGLLTSHFDLEYTAFNDLAVTTHAVTVVGWNFGEAEATLPPSDALVVRYRHDGTLDPQFGDGGVVLLDFMGGEAVCGPLVKEH
jgi:hypothetical protein